MLTHGFSFILLVYTHIYREKNAKTAKQLKVLSANVANSLGKKLEIRDYKRLTKDHHQDLIAQLGVSASKSRNLMDQSRELLNTRSLNVPESGSEANQEFDYLLQNLNNPDTDYISEDETPGFTPASAHHAQHKSGAAGAHRSSHSTPFRQTPGVAAASAKRSSSARAARSASAGRVRTGGATPSSPTRRSFGVANVGGGESYDSLRQTIDALVKQNERLEERLTVHQRELSSLRENQRSTGVYSNGNAQNGNRSAPGSPQRMLNTSGLSTLGEYSLLVIALCVVEKFHVKATMHLEYVSH